MTTRRLFIRSLVACFAHVPKRTRDLSQTTCILSQSSVRSHIFTCFRHHFSTNQVYNETFSGFFSNLAFEDEDLIAVNKPYGQTVYGADSKSSKSGNSNEASLLHILPQVSDHLNTPDIQIGLSLKSYYAGLVLLTKSKHSSDALKRRLAAATSQKSCHLTYSVITVGQPQCKVNEEKQEIYLTREYLHDREMSVVCNKSNQSSRKEGKMIQVVFNMKTVSSNENTQSSLIEVSINKDKWDTVPVLLSHFLSPVLGDIIYSSRTNYLMGVPIRAAPDAAFPGQQRLPPSTERAIREKFSLDQAPLPLFVHRSRITLPGRSKKSSPLEITAPLPQEFQMALDCLGLRES